MQYFGIDIHPTTLRLTVLQEDGRAENRRYDNTPQGRSELMVALGEQPAAVAIGQAEGADDLRRDLAAIVENVLVVQPSEVFSTFPELGKKTFNLARMAHRAMHEANVDALLGKSVAEVKRLVDGQRVEIEGFLQAHLGEFEQRPTLWTQDGQAWLESALATLPAEVQTQVAAGLRRLHVLCQDSTEIDELMSKGAGRHRR